MVKICSISFEQKQIQAYKINFWKRFKPNLTFADVENPRNGALNTTGTAFHLHIILVYALANRFNNIINLQLKLQ